jgi:hypothetical protein
MNSYSGLILERMRQMVGNREQPLSKAARMISLAGGS